MRHSFKQLAQFAQSQVNKVVLSDSTSKILGTAFSDIKISPYDPKNFESFLSSASLLVKATIPSSMIDDIKQFSVDQRGYLEIENLPVDLDLPSTPVKGGGLPNGYKSTYVSEACMLGFSSLLEDAEVFNFRQEAFGLAPLIDNIVPQKHLKEQKGAGGFSNNFPFHTESAWHRLSPSFVLLKGLREDQEKNARTIVTEAKDVLSELTEEEEYILRSPSFKIGAPQLYMQMHEMGILHGTPTEVVGSVFKGDLNSQNFSMMINFNNTSTHDTLGKKVLQWLQDIFY